MLRLMTLSTLCFMLIGGCAVNPVTGERELSLVSAEQEVAIGTQQYSPAQQTQGGRYLIDPEIQAYVGSVGQKLAAVSDRPALPWEFTVLNNPTPNAWALPGGKIAINTGLLLRLENEAQLAAVLAHEIVHAAARHGASQMSRGTLIQLGTQVAGMAAQQAGYGGLGSVAQIGAAAWMARYSREDELEADRYGMRYMAEAGYDPQGAVELQETFVELSKDRNTDFVSGLFASHPPSPERVARNRQLATRLPPGGERGSQRYKSTIARLLKDKPAYEAQNKAIEALNDKDPKLALEYLDRAVKIQPGDGYFWELRGHAWRLLEDYDKAERAFTTAIEKNPAYFSHYLARGVLRYRQEDAGAGEDLKRSYQLLATPVAGFYLGELASREGNSAEALAFYREASRAEGEIGDRARQRLVALELAADPARYIPSQAFAGSNRHLQVVVQNNSGVPVANLVVEVTEMLDTATARRSLRLRGPASLAPGERAVLETGIGPLASPAAAKRFRTQVVAATVPTE